MKRTKKDVIESWSEEISNNVGYDLSDVDNEDIVDYLAEKQLKYDSLNRVIGIDRSELIAAWRDKSGDVFHENRLKTGELKLNDENDCFEVMMRILEHYR
tara:strand:- start:1870 stop:2169 length:300 start_codon:yes stop_codon:yes gene_type:complete